MTAVRWLAREAPRSGACCALVVVASLWLAAGCAKSHRPGDGSGLFDPRAGTGGAGSGVGFVDAGRAGGSGFVGGGGSAVMPDRSPFFNCGGSKVGVCAGDGVGVCFEDGTYQFTPCATAASCVHSGSGAECICTSGTAGDGFTCEDVDECRDGTAQCSRPGTCVNQWGRLRLRCVRIGLRRHHRQRQPVRGHRRVRREQRRLRSARHVRQPAGLASLRCPAGYVALGEQICAAGCSTCRSRPPELTQPFTSDLSNYMCTHPC